ncbi:MAG: flagellar protein FlaG [Brevibacillus sp.]|nr:flagellar protein FlaG [Brevibacillus sp.]
MSIQATGSVGGVSPQYAEKGLAGGTPHESQPARERGAEAASEKRFSKAEMEREIEGLNKWLQSRGTHIKFTLHEKLNEYYVQIVSDETNEVIREIPSKKIMDISAKLQEMIGLLIDEKA